MFQEFQPDVMRMDMRVLGKRKISYFLHVFPLMVPRAKFPSLAIFCIVLRQASHPHLFHHALTSG
jgi:hypothetical protein